MVKKDPPIIPYGRQWIGKEEIDNVVSVLGGDWLSPGPQLEAFEESMAKYCGARYAVAYSNGTAALHGAVHVAGLEDGAEGITSPFTWISSANCMIYEGIVPKFCDIDALTMNLSPASLEAAISKKTKVVIPVHFAGVPCRMDEIHPIAKKAGAVVIEDAAHALGSSFNRGMIGNCEYSDMVCFSFHPVKAITTGEGGMVMTNNKDYYEQLRRFRNLGVIRNSGNSFAAPAADINPEEGPWYFEAHDLGFNYRMTNFQAAIGVAQLGRLPSFIDRRQKISKAYDDAFQRLDVIELPHVPEGMFSSFHLYVIRLRLERLKVGRKEIFLSLREKNLGVQVHYPPVHLQPYYRKVYGYAPGDFPVAEETYGRVISIPIFPKMSDDDVNRVIDGVSEVLRRASR